jgi:AraC-like DNA-binding protein
MRRFGSRARKIYPLSPETIHPLIRIAHRARGSLSIRQRIILDYELVLIVDGSGELIFADGQRLVIAPHALFVIPPFAPHEFRCEWCDHCAVHFDLAPGFPPFARDLDRRKPYEVQFTHGLSLPRRSTLTAGDGVQESIIEIIRLRAEPAPLASWEASLLLSRILLGLLRKSRDGQAATSDAPQSRAQVRIARAVAYANQHFAEKLTAAQLAKAADISPSHFNRLFNEWTGYSPMEYLRRLRVEQARKLLADVDLSIKEIAARTGFDDAYHFSKVFRRIDGLPPTRFRESVLAGQ